MSVTIPYHRNYRAFVNHDSFDINNEAYIRDPKYAESPTYYVKAAQLIISDLEKLFEFVEPAHQNLKTYSHRIHQLLFRTCVEIEANFKAILKENTFTKKQWWTIKDYQLIDKTHHLSSYKITMPFWHPAELTIAPFSAWINNKKIAWYQTYNDTKHDRQSSFTEATFEILLNAVPGLLMLLASQFKDNDFSAKGSLWITGNEHLKGELSLADNFLLHYPTNWSEDEQYKFNWAILKEQEHKFNKFNYDELSRQLTTNGKSP